MQEAFSAFVSFWLRDVSAAATPDRVALQVEAPSRERWSRRHARVYAFD
jgi:hypothetical protein